MARPCRQCRLSEEIVPGDPPSLDGVRLFEIQLQQDGPTVLFRFDLKEYPTDPPKKWKDSQSKRVQLRLIGIGVQKLLLDGWLANNVGNLKLQRKGSGIVVDFKCAGAHFNAVFDHLRLEAASAYRTEQVDSSRVARRRFATHGLDTIEYCGEQSGKRGNVFSAKGASDLSPWRKPWV
ncbi:MAG: hypothetical protein IT462_07075 [Planctomycetes bacterium]|nr:hypothetical protein [Planctomycetota bacterium]